MKLTKPRITIWALPALLALAACQTNVGVRTAAAPQRSQHQFGQFALVCGLARVYGKELCNELRFVDIDTSLFGITKTPRANLTCSTVVNHFRIPKRFDLVANGW